MQAVFLCPILCLFANFIFKFVPKPGLHFALFAATQTLLVSGITFSAQFCPKPLADRRMMAMGLFVFAQNIFLPLPLAALAALTAIQIIAFDGTALSVAGLYSPHENIDLAIQTSGFMALSFLGYQLIEKERRRAWYYNEGEKQKALELAISNRKLQELSNTDGLSGAGNRRFLDQILELSWNNAAKTRRP